MTAHQVCTTNEIYSRCVGSHKLVINEKFIDSFVLGQFKTVTMERQS